MKSLGCVVWRYFLIGVLAWLAIASSPVFAQNTDYCEGRPFTVERGHVICSKHFLLAGKCDGTDQVQKWAVSQWNGQLVGWKIGPWLNYPIGFIGVIIDDYSMSAHSAYPWFVGNNVVPDPMTEMAPDKNRVQTFYQHGYSWPFPAVQSSTDQDYVDLHGSCTGGGNANIGLDLYYTSQGTPPASPAPAAGVVGGSWGDTLSGNGRTISNLSGETLVFAGLRYVAPSGAVALQQVSMSVFANNGGGSFHVELWSDVGGAAGAKIAQSVSVYSGTGTGEVDWGFAPPPAETPGTAYWVFLVPESPGINIDWATVNNDTAFQSNRGAIQGGMTGNGLPDTEQWRVKTVN